MKKTNLKTIKKLLLRDLKYGFYENKYKYLAFIFIILALSIILALGLDFSTKGNFLDVILNLLKGAGNRDKEFPIFWFAINSYVIFIFGSYVYDDYKDNAIYIIPRAMGIREFWISKFLWTILNAVFCYIATFGIIIVVSYVILGGGFSYSEYSKAIMMQDMLRIPSIKELLFTVSISYLLSWIALSVLQVSLSILIKPINAYIVLIAFLSMGIFMPSPMFPAQYLMIVRNEIFDTLYNITLLKTVIYNCGIFIVAILIGIFATRKKELL